MPTNPLKILTTRLQDGSWGRILVASAIVAILLALAGAFGTDFLGAASRAVYWVALASTGVCFAALFVSLVLPRHWFTSHPWLARLSIVLVITAAMTVVVSVTSAVLHHHEVTWGLVLDVAPATFATTAAFTALAFLVRRPAPVTATHAAPAGAPPAKFLGRLTPKLAGAQIWAVEAQDHYLRLHTDKGEDLILMRLTDALVELEGIEGARTHRSWWVARAAVVQAERGDGRATLTLVSGAEVPVSRAYAKSLRDAGWF